MPVQEVNDAAIRQIYQECIRRHIDAPGSLYIKNSIDPRPPNLPEEIARGGFGMAMKFSAEFRIQDTDRIRNNKERRFYILKVQSARGETQLTRKQQENVRRVLRLARPQELQLVTNSAFAMPLRDYSVAYAGGVKATLFKFYQYRKRWSTLFQLIAYTTDPKNDLSLEVVKSCGIQLLEGADFLRAHLIAHGDLKPENTLITDCDRFAGGLALKITDYDTCVECNADGTPTPNDNDTATPSYCCPEYLMRQRYSAFDRDLWAIACIQYYMYNRRRAFLVANKVNGVPVKLTAHEELREQIKLQLSVATEGLPFVQARIDQLTSGGTAADQRTKTNLSNKIRAVLVKMLHPTPARRFPTAIAALNALKATNESTRRGYATAVHDWHRPHEPSATYVDLENMVLAPRAASALTNRDLERMVKEDFPEHYVADYEYHGWEAGELWFHQGDIIVEVESVEGTKAWLFGRNYATGHTGKFPATFVTKAREQRNAAAAAYDYEGVVKRTKK